jgi:hypothetical protein
MAQRTLLMICLSLMIGAVGGCSEPQKTRDPAFIFPKTNPSELTKPISIQRSLYFEDGGSVGVQLRGKNEKETFIFFSQDLLDQPYLKARIYLGVPPDAVLVPEDGEVESVIADLLEDGVQRFYDDAKVELSERTPWPLLNDDDRLSGAKGILLAIRHGESPSLVYFDKEDDLKKYLSPDDKKVPAKQSSK